jgi:hypothetical protein
VSIFDTNGPTKRSPEGPVDTNLIRLLGERMISRKDVKAEETGVGSWHPVTDKSGTRLPFSMADFQDHLTGKRTLGHYLVGTDDTCKFFAFDIDLDKEGYWIDMSSDEDGVAHELMEGVQKCDPREVWAKQEPAAAVEYFTIGLRCLAEGLGHIIHRVLDIPVAILNSGGKGYHVYGFTGTQPANDVRDAALSVLRDLDIFEPVRGENFWKHKLEHSFRANMTIEVFPKQGSLEGKDLGNLMRLPLGVNRKTGRRAHFVNCKVGYNKILEMDPVRALEGDMPWE